MNKTFDKLYKFLLEKKLVTLGLYRLSGATDNTYSYVFTNPSPKTNITARDRIFCLGVEVPRDLMINTNKSNDPPKAQSSEVDKPSDKKSKLDETKILANSSDFYGLKSWNNKRGESGTFSINSEVENQGDHDTQKEGGESQISSVNES